MTVERGLRLLAGVMVLVSVALTRYVSHDWIWLTVFVGLNLLQSSITNWCPAMPVLRAIGLKDARCGVFHMSTDSEEITPGNTRRC